MYGAYHRSRHSQCKVSAFPNFAFWDIRARPLCVGLEGPPFAAFSAFSEARTSLFAKRSVVQGSASSMLGLEARAGRFDFAAYLSDNLKFRSAMSRVRAPPGATLHEILTFDASFTLGERWRSSICGLSMLTLSPETRGVVQPLRVLLSGAACSALRLHPSAADQSHFLLTALRRDTHGPTALLSRSFCFHVLIRATFRGRDSG